MISFQKNSAALRNLHVTIDALECIDSLLALYSDKNHSVLSVTRPGGTAHIQLDVEIARAALVAQRQALVTHLHTIGIDYDA